MHCQQILVLDQTTNEPVEFAMVSLKNCFQGLTDAQGLVTLDSCDLKAEVAITSLGYEPTKIAFEDLKSLAYKVYLKPTIFDIEEIIVSSPRWTNEGNGLKRVANITSANISSINPQTSADMLSGTGEVFVQKSQLGGGSPMIRGFAANRLLYSIDGVRMNTAIFRSGNLQNVISIDPLILSGSSVIFGPGSVAYGSDAVGGVLTFDTKQPTLTNQSNSSGNIFSRVSSASKEWSLHGDLSYKLNKVKGLTSITFNSFGDLRMGKRNGFREYLDSVRVIHMENKDVVVDNLNPYIQHGTGFDMIHLMQKFVFDTSPEYRYSSTFYYSATTDYGRYDRLIRKDNNGIPRSAEWRYGPQRWFFANLKNEITKKTVFYDKLVHTLAYQYFEESRYDRDAFSQLRNFRKENVHAFSWNSDFIKKFNDKNVITYGLEGILNNVNSIGYQQNIETTDKARVSPRYPESKWSSTAIFGHHTYRHSSSLQVLSGLRLNYFYLHSKFDTQLFPLPFESLTNQELGWAGNIGIVYRPTNEWKITTSFSTGFRTPNVDDSGKIFDSTPGSVTVPNNDLKSEIVYNAELFIGKTLFDKVSINLTSYVTKLNGGITRRNFTFDGLDSIIYDGNLSQVQSNVNAASIDLAGFQFGVEAKDIMGFYLKSSFNFQKGKEELEDGSISSSRHVSPYFGLASISYKTSNIEVGLVSEYSGGFQNEELPIVEQEKPFIYAKDSTGKPFSPSWTRLDAFVRIQTASFIDLSLEIENIFDQMYRPYSSGLVAPGRGVIISFTYKW